MTQPSKYLKVVRNQYEDYPYPTRDPAEEKHRLLRFVLSELSAITHYCYRGKRDLAQFRVLVAGGGTGDATIFLAHQLQDEPNAQVVHLDLSRASIQVAQKRAKVRGLTNIEWVHASLLDLPTMDLAPFDYINCTGVLHHLADPDEGLLALKSVLKPDGAMGIMLYATHGRAGIYHMQEMLRILNQNERSMESCVKNAKAALGALPRTNWFQHNNHMLDDVRLGDAGIYDMLLHSHDRAYTVPECYQFAADAGLHFGGFAAPADRLLLSPEHQVSDPDLRAKINALPQQQREAAMELFTGAVLRHNFYLTAQPDRCATLDDPDNVPYLFSLTEDFGHKFADGMRQRPDQPMVWKNRELTISVPPSRYGADLLEQVDGNRTLGEVFEAVRNANGGTPTDSALRADFATVFEPFNRVDFMLLRHRSVAPFPPATE